MNGLGKLTQDETRFLRILRCGDVYDRDEFAQDFTRALVLKLHGPEYTEGAETVALDCEDARPCVVDFLRRCAPIGSWSGQEYVDLDLVGDAGMFVYDALDWLEEDLLGFTVSGSESNSAECLAEDYIQLAYNVSGGTYSPYDDDSAEGKDILIAEFQYFLEAWQLQVIAAIETQATAARSG
jgi:hypothetical protein